jgi:membrane-bound inhibitor of C-type lysozyme
MTRAIISCAFTAILLAGCSDSSAPGQQGSNADRPTEAPAEPVSKADSAATAESDSPHTILNRYRCDAGGEFLLGITGSSASLEIESSIYELRRQPAASGEFYSGEVWQVHCKGDKALLIGQDSTRECQLLPGSEAGNPLPVEQNQQG